MFNNYSYDSLTPQHEKVGFTMSNTIHQCTKANPCEVTYNNSEFSNEKFGGTNSDIKTALETWYKNNLKDVNEKIAQGYFCNDTSSPGYEYNSNSTSRVYYGAQDRVVTKNVPSLKCPDPVDSSNNTRPYGGIYKTKIGLITADELNMAGSSWNNQPYAEETNYLYHDYLWWSMSPHYSSDYAGFYTGRYDAIINEGTLYVHAVVPVINLKADVQVTGNGSEQSPFVVN